MAKIPLRSYLKEIENLIERGEIEQAIAHGKNILRAYPKHIETYRLLGKAFLESQRYSEASDILQRVLSVIPDDFVSQIGMSIIREDEGNLDAAIWHMERAYEVQPFNPAVQDELRRLYGRRDGIEPPKIRLTRGALVRMYARGELYPQAIAETRAALAEDAQRLDLRVLLARLYYLSGQKNDAAEVCSELIAKLPYCYEANRLLAEILPTTSRAEETPKFQQRIYALDPYEAFVSPSAPTSQQVPDQAVMVEQFLWEPGAEAAQAPEWTRTVGVAWEETEEENLPDWLNTLKPETPAGAQRSAQPEPPLDTLQNVETVENAEPESDLVPDWMKDAGWAATDRSAEEIMAEQGAVEEELRPAEIPDWLQSMAPPEAIQGESQEEERTEWLESIFTQPSGENGKEVEQTAPAAVDSPETELPVEETPDWLSNLAQTTPSQEAETSGLPDWLSQAQDETPAASSEDLPDWSQFGATAGEETAEVTDDTPDWLKSFGAETNEPTTAEESLPDWIMPGETAVSTETADLGESAAFEMPTAFEESVASDEATASAETTNFEEAAVSSSVPDWLSALASDTDQIESQESTFGMEVEAPETEAPESVEMYGGDEPEIELQPDETVPGLPEWMDAGREEPAPEAVSAASDEFPPQPDLSDIDATMAWLEALAARQGADEATLITPPAQRTEAMPGWVQKEMDEEQTPAQEPLAAAGFVDFETSSPEAYIPVEGMAESEDLTAAVDLPAEIGPAAEDAFESSAAQEFASAEGEEVIPAEEAVLPDWLAEIEQPQQVENVSPAETSASMPDLTDEASALAWLESLAARQGADEATLITAPEDRVDVPPEWVKKEIEDHQALEEQAVSQNQVVSEELVLPELEGEFETTASVEAVDLAGEQAPVEAELPEWLTAVDEAPVSAPTDMEQASEPAAEIPAQAEAAMPDFSDMDAAMAWLESLAARQGADEATLVTPPEQRTDVMPDWVQKEADKTEAASEADDMSEQQPAEEEVPEWLAQNPTAPEPAEAVEPPAGEEFVALEGLAGIDTVPAYTTEAPTTVEEPELVFGEPQAEQETQPESWLSEVEVGSAEQEFRAEQGIQAEESVQTEETPEWLQGLEEESSVSSATDEPIQWGAELESTPAGEEMVPDWLKPAEAESQPVQAAEEVEEFPEWLMGLEEETSAVSGLSESESGTLPGEYRSAWEPEIAGDVEYDSLAVEAAPQPVEAAGNASSLLELQTALNRGDLDMAMEGYSQFIQNDQYLEEVIHDLRDALYRFPVDISIWQTLGDAYARNNQLQEALDAYTKAEELLR